MPLELYLRTKASPLPKAVWPGSAVSVNPATYTLPAVSTLTGRAVSLEEAPNWRVQTSAPLESYLRRKEPVWPVWPGSAAAAPPVT